MTTATATPKQRKPRKKQPRTIGIVQAMNADGKDGIIRITEGRKVDEYFLDRTETGFQMQKRVYVQGEEFSYRVCLNVEPPTCSCKGFTFTRHCRHVSGLTALKNARKL